jgi:L-alanine-DL-glutamate epimerase-like enolase superfamily enzyme
LRIEDGALDLPDPPGIGFEAQPRLYALMRSMTDDVAG